MEQLSFREMFVRYQEALRDADKVMCTLERLVATNWECDCEKLKMRQISGFLRVTSKLADLHATLVDQQTQFGLLDRIEENDGGDGWPYELSKIIRIDKRSFLSPSHDNEMEHFGYQIASIRSEIELLSEAAFDNQSFPLDSMHTVTFHMTSALELAFRLTDSDEVINQEILSKTTEVDFSRKLPISKFYRYGENEDDPRYAGYPGIMQSAKAALRVKESDDACCASAALVQPAARAAPASGSKRPRSSE